MSKRFGRNQKRRMKQIIVAQNAAVNKLETERTVLRNKLSDYGDTIRLTADVLGRHFCTLPPEVIRTHGLDRSHLYRMTKPIEFNPSMLNPPTMSEVIESTVQAVRELEVYRTELRTDELRDQVHVRIQGPRDECYGYALSAEMKRAYPKEMLIELVSRELATMMVEHWK